LKLDEIVSSVPDLSNLTIEEGERLKVNDIGKIFGEYVCIVETAFRGKGGKYYIKYRQSNGIEDTVFLKEKANDPVPMTNRDKKTMTKNITENMKNFEGDERKILRMAVSYWYNLAQLNNYLAEDIDELMNLFPDWVLSKLHQYLIIQK